MILTLKELADYLRVNERTILRMLKTGQIQGAKIGGQWRFNGSQIDNIFFPAEEKLNTEETVPLNEITASPMVIPVNRVLTENRIIPHLESADRDAVLRELTKPVIHESLLLDVKDLLQRLQDRENLISTAVGDGVAIPHPRDPIATLRVPAAIVLGRSPEGIAFGSSDDPPVHLFFLLVCKNIQTHLLMMGRLARLLKSDDFIQRCMKADDAHSLFRLVLEAEQNQMLKKRP